MSDSVRFGVTPVAYLSARQASVFRKLIIEVPFLCECEGRDCIDLF